MQAIHQHHASVPDYAFLGAADNTSGYTPGMYQDTSEFASRLEDEKTAGNGSGSIASFHHNVGRGHKHGLSGGNGTDLSHQEYLSMNDVEGKDEDQFSYEQVVGNPDSISDQDRKGEPTLITTLAPYNYEIDLPFKQASTKHTCKASRKKLN